MPVTCEKMKLWLLLKVFATSKDGTRIPMFIVARKGINLDGKNPTLLYGYGGGGFEHLTYDIAMLVRQHVHLFSPAEHLNEVHVNRFSDVSTKRMTHLDGRDTLEVATVCLGTLEGTERAGHVQVSIFLWNQASRSPACASCWRTTVFMLLQISGAIQKRNKSEALRFCTVVREQPCGPNAHNGA